MKLEFRWEEFFVGLICFGLSTIIVAGLLWFWLHQTVTLPEGIAFTISVSAITSIYRKPLKESANV